MKKYLYWFWAHLTGVLGIGMLLVTFCQGSADSDSAVYIVTLKQTPTAAHYYGELRKGFQHSSFAKTRRFQKPSNISRSPPRPGHASTSRVHDVLLKKVFRGEKYLKLYSYHYLINGFALFVTPRQAEKLAGRREVANVVLDFSVRIATTHTPDFLGLTSSNGAWAQAGGHDFAGERVVIGFVDTGIDPTHPSFSDTFTEKIYPVPPNFSGVCEVTPDFPSGSCNRKLLGARHFAASAITRGIFNATKDYASPFDGDGHGSHTTSVAAGNHGVPVTVDGLHFGNASGMAPRAQCTHIAIYKALYKGFGGFSADVVAAIDQAAQDGVDIISLSITPNRRPPGIATFFNPIDMALLTAVKAGIFVVQAAGNTGPSLNSVCSFSPWIFTVGAASHDRVYYNSITLGDNKTLSGVGLARTSGDAMYTLVLALHALNNETTVGDDTYAGECQDPNSLSRDIIQGNLLICSYSIRFVLGFSTVKQALQTAKNLSAVGIVFYLDPFVIGFQLNPTPMELPGIIIPSTADSKIFLQYYNSSVEMNAQTKKVIKFGAIARISGGMKGNYNNSAPKVMFYSARGPDPENGSLDDADILKPNVIAPGNSIWAAWSPLGTDSVEFEGEKFAMMSGTSMAAPHVAGLAALIKQKFPHFSPSAIGSALSTTASLYDNTGGPIMAQRAYDNNSDLSQSLATPFDMGSGFVNATAALDPGLIFDSSYDDYMSFLCGINGSAPVVLNYTGQNCGISAVSGADLNLPSITIAKLNQSRTVLRTALNVGGNENYTVQWFAPYGVSVLVSPTNFFIASGEKQVLTVTFNAAMNSSQSSFGRIGLVGDRGHLVDIQVSIIVKISHYNNSTNNRG